MDFQELLKANEKALQPRAMRSDNTSGHRGVWKSGKRWRAEIRIEGKKRCLGTFATLQEAIDARQRAEDESGL